MRCYSHLSDDEREQIGLAKAVGHSIGAIAKAIGRPKSTVSRELLRKRAEKRLQAERTRAGWSKGDDRIMILKLAPFAKRPLV